MFLCETNNKRTPLNMCFVFFVSKPPEQSCQFVFNQCVKFAVAAPKPLQKIKDVHLLMYQTKNKKDVKNVRVHCGMPQHRLPLQHVDARRRGSANLSNYSSCWRVLLVQSQGFAY